jgi:hypothetical protein
MNRIPSPADLARRPAPATPATPKPALLDAVAVGVLTKDERFKPMYTWALLMSGMQPEARLLAHTLLWYARHTDGHISPAYQPSVDELVAATGLAPARISTQIEILRQRGWLRLASVPDGPRAGSPRYELTIPALYLQRVRARRIERTERQATNARHAAARQRR